MTEGESFQEHRKEVNAIEKNYYNLETSYQNAEKLYQDIKKYDFGITRKGIKVSLIVMHCMLNVYVYI